MTILKATNEFDGLDYTNGLWSGSYHDATYTRGSMGFEDADEAVIDIGSQAEFWLHCEMRIDTNTHLTGGLINFGGDARIYINAFTKSADFQYYSSGWVTEETGVIPNAVLTVVDVHFDAGVYSLYASKVLIFSYDTGTATISDITLGQAGTTGAFYNQYFSQVLIQTEPTLGCKVHTLPVTADGALTDMTNDYTAIDEEAIPNDSDFITPVTTGDQSSFVIDDSVTPPQHAIIALVHNVRAIKGSTGLQNLQIGTYSNGTAYPQASVTGLDDVDYKSFHAIEYVDPDDSSDWDDTSVAQAQLLVKAIT